MMILSLSLSLVFHSAREILKINPSALSIAHERWTHIDDDVVFKSPGQSWEEFRFKRCEIRMNLTNFEINLFTFDLNKSFRLHLEKYEAEPTLLPEKWNTKV